MEFFKNNLHQVMNFGEDCHLKSNHLITWSVLLPNPNDSSINFDFDWSILSGKPIFLENSSLRSQLGISGILILVLFSQVLLNPLMQSLQKIVNKSTDKLIFFGQNEYIDALMENKFFKTLGWKIVISNNSHDIWTNPYTFQNGHMEKWSNFKDKKWPNQFMGDLIRGREFRGTTFEIAPYHTKVEGPGGNFKIEGSLVTMMDHFAEKFNFSYTLDYVGADYGSLLENGTYTGLVGQMADPLLGYDFAVIFAYEEFSFGTATFPSYGQVQVEVVINFVTQHGQKMIPLFAFLYPFNLELWLWTIGTFTFLGLIQMFITWLNHGRNLNLKVWNAGIFMPLSLTLEQGIQNIPKGIRYIALIILLAQTILGTGYKSKLLANLTFPEKSSIPSTFLELLARDDYKINLLSLGMEENFTGENPTMKRLFEDNRITIIHNPDFEQLVRETFLSEKSALIFYNIIESIIIGTITLKNTDELPLQISKDYVYNCMANFALVHQSIFVDSFRDIIYSGIESGLYSKNEDLFNEKLLRKGSEILKMNPDSEIMHKLDMLNDQSNFQTNSLTFENLKIVFAIIIFGAFLSFLVFIIELEIHSHIFSCLIKLARKVILAIYEIAINFVNNEHLKLFRRRLSLATTKAKCKCPSLSHTHC